MTLRLVGFTCICVCVHIGVSGASAYMYVCTCVYVLCKIKHMDTHYVKPKFSLPQKFSTSFRPNVTPHPPAPLVRKQ